MTTSGNNAGVAFAERIALRTVQILLALFTGLMAIRIWFVEGGEIWKLFAGMFACSAVSAILRLGWLVPCMIGGIIFGISMDADIKGGTIESKMWETVANIGFGAALGLLAGLLIDHYHRLTQTADEIDKDSV